MTELIVISSLSIALIVAMKVAAIHKQNATRATEGFNQIIETVTAYGRNKEKGV